MSGQTSMKYVRLGTSGFKVSKVILGAMSFGSPKWSSGWVLGPEDSYPVLKAAWDAGITTWDTANMYSNGESEKIVGQTLKKYNIPRSQVQILTKAYFPCCEDQIGVFNGNPEVQSQRQYVNRQGLSRIALFEQVNASLERLQTDYIDLLQIHRIDDTPFTEVMKALHDLVESGKVRYIGASSMWAHELAQLQAIAEHHNWTKFISMQCEHSLLYREEEREMMRYCNKTGVGLIPWGPVAAGALTRPISDHDETVRGKGSERMKAHKEKDADSEIIKRVQELAKKKGWSMAQVAFAWSAQKNTAPIIGMSKTSRIDEYVKAIEYALTEEEVKHLEEPYVPMAPRGFTQDRTTS